MITSSSLVFDSYKPSTFLYKVGLFYLTVTSFYLRSIVLKRPDTQKRISFVIFLKKCQNDIFLKIYQKNLKEIKDFWLKFKICIPKNNCTPILNLIGKNKDNMRKKTALHNFNAILHAILLHFTWKILPSEGSLGFRLVTWEKPGKNREDGHLTLVSEF